MVGRTFRHEAESRGLSFDVRVDPRLGRSIVTDAKRLQQVLKNLLSNAFKFTVAGRRAAERVGGRRRLDADASGAQPGGGVVAFEVSDTGIGIPPEKQRIIFEAFQQADASTSRKYGGTGLGLAISRELASLLGGEIQLRSTPGVGSTFTLYLPIALRRARRSSAVRDGDGERGRHAGMTLALPGRPAARAADRGRARRSRRRAARTIRRC